MSLFYYSISLFLLSVLIDYYCFLKQVQKYEIYFTFSKSSFADISILLKENHFLPRSFKEAPRW